MEKAIGAPAVTLLNTAIRLPFTVLATAEPAKAAANGFYRSDDAGSTWKLVNSSNGTEISSAYSARRE